VRLVLCDGNRLLCEALGAALADQGHKVLAIATSAELGIAAVAEHEPDACVLALHFSSPPDGLDAARAIRDISPQTAVLMMSGHPDPAAVSEALRIGAAGFLGKAHDVVDVVTALETIASGGLAVDPRVTGGRVSGRQSTRHRRPGYELTPRESEVLRRMVEGQSTIQMSRSMNIAPSTLRTYIRNVLAKLGVHSRLQAVALAAREQLLSDTND
jgi:two-component system nitrate/nitrite response regulator NarL